MKTKLLNYVKSKGVGFWIGVGAYIIAIIAFAFFASDIKINPNADTAMENAVITMMVFALVLPVVFEIAEFVLKEIVGLKFSIDFFELIPILFSVLVTASLITYIGGKVDLLGYIFTDHYGFFDGNEAGTYPELGLSLIFFIIDVAVCLVMNFFGLRKGNKIKKNKKNKGQEPEQEQVAVEA